MKLYLRVAALLGMTAVGLAALQACGPEAGIGAALAMLTQCDLLPSKCPFPVLYVANYTGNNVARYDMTGNYQPGHSGPAHVTPDTAPVGVAAKNPYLVTDQISGSVTVFQYPVLNDTKPTATFGTSAGGFMAFDRNGNLWATSQNAVVVEYVPPFTNSTTESNGLTDGITDSYGIVFDSEGDMFISNADSSGTIAIYSPPYNTLGATITVPEANPRLHGLAISGSELLVADTRNNTILVYNLPITGNTPSTQFTATAPLGLAADDKGNLYVTEQGNNKLDVFQAPFTNTSTSTASITTGLNGAFGLSIYKP